MIVDRYYYAQLNKQEQAVYKAFYNGLMAHEDVIPIPIKGQLTKEVFNKIFRAMTRDNPLIYYVNQSACNWATDAFGHTAICPQYFYSRETVRKYNRNIENAVNNLAAQLKLTEGTDYEKEVRVHDWFCKNVKYDFKGSDMDEPTRVVLSHNIVGVFAKQKAQCEGIAKAVKVLLNAVDIKCIVATGEAEANGKKEHHAWNVIDIDGRIHSSFNQTVTTTGRLSSTEPNLQNIPIRMELGRAIRKVFLPEDGYVFLDADYSQIELRVLAHLSQDEKLIHAYEENQDIHARTASEVFGIPMDEVTSTQRRDAKAVNFGIIYGLSAFGLSQDLKISRKQAQEYIDRYFAMYPRVKEFLDGEVEKGKTDGYVKTMFNRIRPIPELKSSNFMQRNFGERVAMNSPIQGTAADIIKIAMVRVNMKLKEKQMKSRLLLQIHDELLIETHLDEFEEVKEILQNEMMNAVSLRVPLNIDIEQGASWYEAK